MTTEFDKELINLEKEIIALKQAKLKWAGNIATIDYSRSATFRVDEVDYGLFSTKALNITATNPTGDSFLSQIMFSGNWDGRGWAHSKIYESKGKTKWCLAMVVPRQDDYTRYYGPTYDQRNPFDISLDFVIRATSAINITTEWVDNPYTRVW